MRKKIFLAAVGVALIALIYFFGYGVYQMKYGDFMGDEDNEFASRLLRYLALADGEKVKLANIYSGDWEFACINWENNTPSYSVRNYLEKSEGASFNVLPNDIGIVDGHWGITFYFRNDNTARNFVISWKKLPWPEVVENNCFEKDQLYFSLHNNELTIVSDKE